MVVGFSSPLLQKNDLLKSDADKCDEMRAATTQGENTIL
jgi:hypothetical protein